MPGRKFDAEAQYRYGFNRQEKSREINAFGNILTAEYWEYDTRIGRRWNRDPIVKEFESPYATFLNNPLVYTDELGLDPKDPEYKLLENVTVKNTRKPKKEGDVRINYRKITIKDPFDPSLHRFQRTRTITVALKEKFHEGSKYFDRGWYSHNDPNPVSPDATDYELTQFDWDNGQVMREKDWREYIMLEIGGERDWNGWAVNSKGYLTGHQSPLQSNVSVVARFRSVSRYLITLSRLMYSSTGRVKTLNKIQNSGVRNLVNDMYRKQNIGKELKGSGSAADAFRWTAETGQLIGMSEHRTKLLETVKRCTNLMKGNSLNSFDKRVVTEILNDIKNALRGN